MSSTAAIQVSKEAPSFQVPAFYRTSPPPHHTSAEPLKSGFQSPWPSTGPHSFLKFLRGRLFDWNEVPLPSSDKLPVVKQATFDNQEAVGEKIKFTWLGHAGCHVQIPVPGSSKPVTVLTDPVLSQRCSPFQWFGPARFTKACTTVTEMASSSAPAAWPDVVVLSHNHYDHLDLRTIKALISKPNGKAIPHFICTLGVKQWFLSLGLTDEQVTELDWWDERVIKRASDGAKMRFTCVPAQHFSGRGASDRDKTLWAGWAMQAIGEGEQQGAKIYFAGDTGYRDVARGMTEEQEDQLPVCPAFKEIGDNLGPFDLSLIPIGAYLPRYVMSAIHANPRDAVRIHQDVRSKKTYGIHFGVFRLTPEDVNEPTNLLKVESEKAGLKDEFVTCNIGETVIVP